ncbi:MAG: hypothetical protein NTU83_03640 [Candidatus Hydrogenedentes bacterium]|nr:hypothetical protein [Candidatus Hydrogenedentota bacterium]
MNPRDTFNLISFSGGTGYCFQNIMPNTTENRAAAVRYLDQLQGGGGTEMMPAILAALGGPRDPERLRTVCFMTDGFIGNDMEILAAVKENAANARVFAFGIGNGVNRLLIEGMARTGRGASEIVTLESQSDEAVRRFHERIHSPVLTDIGIGTSSPPNRSCCADAMTAPRAERSCCAARRRPDHSSARLRSNCPAKRRNTTC